jgi:hypothetical protein
LGEQNIKLHRAHIMQKMGVESLADLVRAAERLGVGKSETPSLESAHCSMLRIPIPRAARGLAALDGDPGRNENHV